MTTASADNPPGSVYQNAASVVAPPRKKSGYENVNSSSSIGAAGGDVTGGTEDATTEKRKPVPRTRHSLRNRGAGIGRSMDDVSAMSQSPPLIEQDERLPGNLGVLSTGSGGGSSREDSISPDLRNNTPSPRPKPRGGKRGLDSSDNTSVSSLGGGAPPLLPAKPHSTSSPSRRGAPPGPPPKIPKTIVTDSSSTSSSAGGKKKPALPALPPRGSTPENRLNGGGGGGSGAKRSLSGNQDHRTEVSTISTVSAISTTATTTSTAADEDPYSSVDRTQFTDTGPPIQVLDVSSGKSLPLEFVEREMESAGRGEADTSKSSSILDTVSWLVYRYTISQNFSFGSRAL